MCREGREKENYITKNQNMKSKTENLCFIVNGTETYVKAKSTDLLSEVAEKALKQSGNIGRPLSDFQAIAEDEFLALHRTVEKQTIVKNGKFTKTKILKPDSVIFLSLKAGIGASARHYA